MTEMISSASQKKRAASMNFVHSAGKPSDLRILHSKLDDLRWRISVAEADAAADEYLDALYTEMADLRERAWQANVGRWRDLVTLALIVKDLQPRRVPDPDDCIEAAIRHQLDGVLKLGDGCHE